MEKRWYLGVAALLLVVVAVIVFLLLPARDAEPTPADAALAEKRPVAPTMPTKQPSLAADAGTKGTMGIVSGDSDPIGGGTATLTGRVLLDGQPVASYSLVVTKARDAGMWTMPHDVRSAEGAFAFEKVRTGTWNVIIGAPGIARKLITDVKLVDGQVTDLGDIDAKGGIKITGTVTDRASHPIAGATVAISGTGLSGFTVTAVDTGEVLSAPTAESESMHGKQSTVTDARGRYQLTGVVSAIGMRERWIEVAHPNHGESPRTKIPDDDATLDFVLGGSGAIDGRITVPLTQPASIVARRITGIESPAQTRTDAEGQFRFEALYPGTYRVTVRSGGNTPVWHPITVEVASGKRASVTLAEPKVMVTLEVPVTRMCMGLDLRVSSSDSIVDAVARANCPDQKTAVFERIEPGTYVLCKHRECIPIEVATTPAVQRFDGAELEN